MSDRTEQIREVARKWLTDGTVEAVIGWTQGTYRDKTSPVLVRKPEDVDQLLFNERCTNNLVSYLKRDHVQALEKVGLVAKGCDIKAFIGILQESQIEREKVKILAVSCPGVKNSNGSTPVKCQACDVNTPTYFDELVGDKVESNPEAEARFKDLEALDAMSSVERYRFWREQLDKCIRCYACQRGCPLCNCTRCIAEKNQPQWVETSPHPKGNFSWNLVRAYHLAGRCVECEACETACPVNIPLMLLNRAMARTVQGAFEYEAGKDPELQPPLRTFDLDDDNSFIL